MTKHYKLAAFRRDDENSGAYCLQCGQPSDDDICALAAQFRRRRPEWSSRRCFDRAYIAAAKGAKPERQAA